MKKCAIFIISLIFSIALISCDDPKELMEANEGAQVPYLDGGWVSVWNDEFDGDQVDLTKWNYETGGGGWGNNELQYYTDNHQNTIVSDGTLKIIAKREQKGSNQYTSARMTTHTKGDWLYGRMQIRAKLPKGVGTWPAIWMMPSWSTYGSWPDSGEIDIMEHVGHTPGEVHTSIHTKKYNHMKGNNQQLTRVIPTAQDEFHLYEIIWEPGMITAYYDDELLGYFRYTSAFNRDVESYEAFPFDHKFFMILNMAIGGSWGGSNIDINAFPCIMEVDYVRVYQKDYNYLDIASPQKVEQLTASDLLKNSIWWKAGIDDEAVSHYEIYVDGALHQESNLSQVLLKRLTKGQTYEIKVRAVDFVGNKGEFSDSINFTFKE